MNNLIIIITILLATGCHQARSNSSIGTEIESTKDTEDTEDTESVIIPDNVDVDTETLVASIEAKEVKDCLNIGVPHDQCNNDNLIIFTGEVLFNDGKCNYSFELEPCIYACKVIENSDAKCIMPCDSITCNDPPDTKISFYTSVLNYSSENSRCLDEHSDLPKGMQGTTSHEEDFEPFCSYTPIETKYDCPDNSYIILNKNKYECITCPENSYIETYENSVYECIEY